MGVIFLYTFLSKSIWLQRQVDAANIKTIKFFFYTFNPACNHFIFLHLTLSDLVQLIIYVSFRHLNTNVQGSSFPLCSRAHLQSEAQCEGQQVAMVLYPLPPGLQGCNTHYFHLPRHESHWRTQPRPPEVNAFRRRDLSYHWRESFLGTVQRICLCNWV